MNKIMLFFEECTGLYWEIIFGRYVKLISTLKAYDAYDAFLITLTEHVIFALKIYVNLIITVRKFYPLTNWLVYFLNLSKIVIFFFV
jgi:hypothetical protein